MFGVILKATNRSFQKNMTFCRSIYVKKVMKLLAFIFEQPSYYLFNRKTIVFFEIFSGYFMGNPSLRLSEVLRRFALTAPILGLIYK